ncbi:MAG: hypothetical protein Q4F17_09385 [Eubacteriales bacterium]|nr:hypothetical protein [Eubacteriales bacterium]
MKQKKQPPWRKWDLNRGFRHIQNKKTMSRVYFVLRLSVLLVMAAQFFNRNYENVFLCLLTLALFLLPSLIERRLKIDLPDTLEIIILLFIFAAEILGEIRAYYVHFKHWDTMLHTLNGFLCAAIGFSLVDLLNRNERLTFRLSPAFMAITAFCFSMTVGVMWEFFEYFSDTVLGLDMQKDTVVNTLATVMLDETSSNKVITLSGIADTVLVFRDGSTRALGLGGYLDVGIRDTMKDLLVNFLGATVFSVVGYFYVKSRGQGKFAQRFIPQVMENEKDDPGEGAEE